jgi:mono/diheme cytochrome c family protein
MTMPTPRPAPAHPAPAHPTPARIVPALVAALLLAVPAAADPKSAFVARCAMCHQAGGEGLAGQFPRLAGRAAAIAQSPEGRRYMARVVLNGMSGPIEVEGAPVTGVMPGMASLSDAEIADVLSHALTLGKPARPAKAFKAAEIAAVRAEGRVSMADNRELRARLVTDGVIR